MRLPLPRTLLWRSFLLFTVLISLSVCAWFGIYQKYAIKPRIEQAAEMLTSVVNLTRAALLASNTEHQTALLRDLKSRQGIRIFPAEKTDKVAPPPHNGFHAALTEALEKRLGPTTRTTRKLNGQNGFFIRFVLESDAEDDDYWLMLPVERVMPADIAGWVGWAIATGLFSLLGAWLFTFSINKPLRALRDAARLIGQGEKPATLPARGSQEFVELAQAFNQMSHDLTQLEADRALVLAGVSHDLRTPLARLRLGLELSASPPEDIAEMSLDIEEMDRIIGQFLDFARAAQHENDETCDLAELISQIASPYQRRGHAVTLTLAPCPSLQLRPQAIRRAYTNLIDNALRYAGATSPIDILLHTHNNIVTLSVNDRGPGIPPEQVERLKRPFTRLNEARSNLQGSGLGLAIVERIAKLHDAEFTLSPRIEGGFIEGGLCAAIHFKAPA